MKFFNRHLLLLAFALSSASGLAVAAGEAESIPGSGESADGAKTVPSFSEVDENSNGIIEATEAAAAGVNMVASDINKDGHLDRAEWERVVPSTERGALPR